MYKYIQLLVDKRIRLELHDSARAWLASEGYQPQYGARPLKRVIQRYYIVIGYYIGTGRFSRAEDALLSMLYCECLYVKGKVSIVSVFFNLIQNHSNSSLKENPIWRSSRRLFANGTLIKVKIRIIIENGVQISFLFYWICDDCFFVYIICGSDSKVTCFFRIKFCHHSTARRNPYCWYSVFSPLFILKCIV